MTERITITVDGRFIEAEPDELLIRAAERNGIYIPRFCWHPRMDPVGACRMCLVDIEGSPPIPGTSQRRPQTACTTVVRHGMVVHTQFSSPEVNEAQKTILELLLINHPLDCPICDRGGECPLQDQTQDYGPNESRFTEPKRRFRKPVEISPLIKLDRERCILCYRCTRFCEEIAGEALLGVMERGPESYIFPLYSFERADGSEAAGVRGPDETAIDRVFDSYFSGNTVQICPVGALTSTSYRFMARPWDVQDTPSICSMCSCGCSVYVGVRVQDGNVARISAATCEATNEEWLCDRGRYGAAYISSPDRLTEPLVRREGGLVPVTWDEAFRELGERLRPVLAGDAAAGLVLGEQLCDEDYYTAQKFARVALRTNNVDHRLEGGLEASDLLVSGLTYDDVLGCDLVVVVSADLREELPILHLRLRVAASKRGVRVAVAHPRATATDRFAELRLRPLPGREAELAAALMGADPDPAGIGVHERDALRHALEEADRGVVLLGPGAHAPGVVRAWRAACAELGARLAWLPRRAGTMGALAAGAHPGLLPGWRRLEVDADVAEVARAWGAALPAEAGLDVFEMLGRAGELGVLWLVGADLVADVPGSLGEEGLARAPFVVVQDVLRTPLVERAHVVLPAASFAERAGTLTNWEGRRQAVQAASEPVGAARADYAILAEAARRLGRPIGCRTAADAGRELEELLADRTPPQIVPETPPTPAALQGGVRLLTYRLLYDDGARLRQSYGLRRLTPLSFVELHPSDAEVFGVSDGQTVRVVSEHGSITTYVRTNTDIRPGVAFVPWSQWGVEARVLVTPQDRHPLVSVEPA